MRALRLVAPLVVVLVAAFPAPSAAKPRAPRCVVPRRWHVVARNPRAVLIQGTVNVKNAYGGGTDGPERQWRYCAMRRAWHWAPLVAEAGQPGGYVDIVMVGPVALAGIYAAYAATDELGGGRYGAVTGLTVTNVLTGESENADVTGVGFVRVALAPPFAAWISFSETGGGLPYNWFVQTFDGRSGKTTLVDSTCPQPPSGCDASDASNQSPFTDLQLLRCLDGCPPGASTSAVWSRNGVWRYAPIG